VKQGLVLAVAFEPSRSFQRALDPFDLDASPGATPFCVVREDEVDATIALRDVKRESNPELRASLR